MRTRRAREQQWTGISWSRVAYGAASARVKAIGVDYNCWHHVPSAPSPSTPRSRLPLLGVVSAVVGTALLVVTIRQVGWSEIQRGVGAVGGWFLIVVLLGGVRFLARARSWMLCARQIGAPGLTSRAAFGAVLAGDAVGNLTPLGLLASEPDQGAAGATRAGHRPGAHVGGARQRLLHPVGAGDDCGGRLGARAPGVTRRHHPPGRRGRAGVGVRGRRHRRVAGHTAARHPVAAGPAHGARGRTRSPIARGAARRGGALLRRVRLARCRVVGGRRLAGGLPRRARSSRCG